MQGQEKGEKKFLSTLTIYEQGIADVTRHQDVVFHYNLVWLQKNRNSRVKNQQMSEVRRNSIKSTIFLAFPF